MNIIPEVTYTLGSRRIRHRKLRESTGAGPTIPRIARLMALAIRFERLVREETVQDYAELALLGGVTRARMTQITRLLQLAPDLQEQILFLPEIRGLNERNLRAIVHELDWSVQRRMFKMMIYPSPPPEPGWRLESKPASSS